jgi:hypothetical protein
MASNINSARGRCGEARGSRIDAVNSDSAFYAVRRDLLRGHCGRGDFEEFGCGLSLAMEDNDIPKVVIHRDDNSNGRDHVDCLDCWCMPTVLEMNFDEEGFPIIGKDGLATFSEVKRAIN